MNCVAQWSDMNSMDHEKVYVRGGREVGGSDKIEEIKMENEWAIEQITLINFVSAFIVMWNENGPSFNNIGIHR